MGDRTEKFRQWLTEAVGTRHGPPPDAKQWLLVRAELFRQRAEALEELAEELGDLTSVAQEALFEMILCYYPR